MTRLFTFPGQGSQSPGMGKDWFENFAQTRLAFEEASDASGLDLKKLCFEGSEEDLKQTSITQPAILTVSVGIFEALKTMQDIKASEIYFAGHSLGEYSALVCAGALPLADAARIVRKRGEFMQAAVPSGIGAMAALVFKPGTAGENVAIELCARAETQSGKKVSVANFNSPEQIVISGHKDAVLAAEGIAKADNMGVRKVVMLNVSAPFHCALMQPAADQLKTHLESAKWKNCSDVSYVPNTVALPVSLTDAPKVAGRLYDQITGSVMWSQSMKQVLTLGVTEHLEVGPGAVLTGLMKRIATLFEGKELKLSSTENFASYKEKSGS